MVFVVTSIVVFRGLAGIKDEDESGRSGTALRSTGAVTLRARSRTSLSCTETTSKPQPQPRPLGARAGATDPSSRRPPHRKFPGLDWSVPGSTLIFGGVPKKRKKRRVETSELNRGWKDQFLILKGGGQTRWVFYTNEKSTAANYTTHRMLIWDGIQPRQTSKGLLGHRRASIHRRAAHLAEPQDSRRRTRRTRGRGRQKPIPNERKELELPPTVSQDLRESEEEEEPAAGRRARVQGYSLTTPTSISSLGGLGH